MELSYWKSTKIFVFCQKSCGSKFWIFFKKFQNFENFLEFDFLVFWYIFLYFVTYGRKYWADIMFWISWFCSLLLVKWPIFGQLFGLISQKATTGWFSFWLFSTYLCMYFMKLKWFFMVHDLFETEASQPLWCVRARSGGVRRALKKVRAETEDLRWTHLRELWSVLGTHLLTSANP